jgi:hypothetical protein
MGTRVGGPRGGRRRDFFRTAVRPRIPPSPGPGGGAGIRPRAATTHGAVGVVWPDRPLRQSECVGRAAALR